MSGLVLCFYNTDYIQGFVTALNAANPFIFVVLFVGINGLVEIIAGIILATPCGLALKRGLTVLNTPGTIDADYRGEIGVILINLSNEAQVIEPGERICQMVIAKHEQPELVEVEVLGETERGAGGFGHSGVK